MEYYAFLSFARTSLSLCHFDWPFGTTVRSAQPHKTTPLKRNDAIDSSDTICFDLIDTRTSRRPTILYMCTLCAASTTDNCVSVWIVFELVYWVFFLLLFSPACRWTSQPPYKIVHAIPIHYYCYCCVHLQTHLLVNGWTTDIHRDTHSRRSHGGVGEQFDFRSSSKWPPLNGFVDDSTYFKTNQRSNRMFTSLFLYFGYSFVSLLSLYLSIYCDGIRFIYFSSTFYY